MPSWQDRRQAHSPDSIRARNGPVARNSVMAAIAITLFKSVVGVATGSLGILSEAAHSGLDLVAAIITMLSVRVSDRRADAERQYGHGKFENFSASIETALLLLTCVWIVYEAVRRLFLHKGQRWKLALRPLWSWPSPLPWTGGVRARSNASRTNIHSQALAADALHFATDIWSASVVIVGLALIAIADRWRIHWLRAADPVAALFVAGVVVYVS